MGGVIYISLIHDAKLPKYFDSAWWKRGYNPDVAFVSTRIASMCQRGVLDPILRTQHRPITITIRSPVTATHCPFWERFNLKKANWSKFTNEIDQTIANFPAHPNHYDDLCGPGKEGCTTQHPRRSTSLVCQMSPHTYWNSTMRSTTTTRSLSLLSRSERPYWMTSLMKDVTSGETWWKTPTSPWTAKKHEREHVYSTKLNHCTIFTK